MTDYIISEEQLKNARRYLDNGVYLGVVDILNVVKKFPPLSEHDAEVAKKERRKLVESMEEIDEMIDVLEHDNLTSFNPVYDIVYAWRGLLQILRSEL